MIYREKYVEETSELGLFICVDLEDKNARQAHG